MRGDYKYLWSLKNGEKCIYFIWWKSFVKFILFYLNKKAYGDCKVIFEILVSEPSCLSMFLSAWGGFWSAHLWYLWNPGFSASCPCSFQWKWIWECPSMVSLKFWYLKQLFLSVSISILEYPSDFLAGVSSAGNSDFLAGRLSSFFCVGCEFWSAQLVKIST